MSFTTRCPACGTMFKVVADQLKISEGWVRCGHCADVFDATLFLQPWEASSNEDSAPAAAPVEVEATPASESFISSEPVPGSMEAQAVVDPPSEAEQVVRQEPAPPPAPPLIDVVPEPESDAAPSPLAVLPSPESDGERTQEPPSRSEPAQHDDPDEVESDFHGELERFAAGLGRLNAAQAAPVGVAREALSVSPTATPAAGTDAVIAVPEAPAPDDTDREGGAEVRAQGEDIDGSAQGEPVFEPGFVRQARRQAYWRKPGVRVALSLAALLLLALLTAQWAVHERDRLAASHPGLQPVLQQVCSHLGCRLAPVRRIDAIVIDSASLVNRLGDFYSFDLVLKNTASMVLAVPALELSLTDIGGAVIARRVFLSSEWPDAPAVLPANGSVTVNFRLALAVDESTPMAGYNALVFYP